MAEFRKPKHDKNQPKPMRARMWWIVISPSAWAVHFLACYITAAIWCEKFSDSGNKRNLDLGVTAYTLVALAVIAGVTWLSFKNFRRSDPPVPFNFDAPSERTDFLSFTAFLLSLLSLVATLFTALVFVMVRSCD
ncbi:hypothetical protein V7x_39120 [Crateriforma conspicua]|uniref:Uncharacterized protein n=2 Tax=Planctomycetaceae TaxID=126 RepID=A0A5C6FP70_9PLAN|nr:hypothetical protein V7x_39120 [Crateriforma conspicua]